MSWMDLGSCEQCKRRECNGWCAWHNFKAKFAEFAAHWRCVLTHRPHWFMVAGVTLCRVCDAHLLERIIQSAPPVDNALAEFAEAAERGLRNVHLVTESSVTYRPTCPIAYEKTHGEFYCTREPLHEGPCAAVPVDGREG